jgi:hypothetical protein
VTAFDFCSCGARVYDFDFDAVELPDGQRAHIDHLPADVRAVLAGGNYSVACDDFDAALVDSFVSWLTLNAATYLGVPA